MNLPDPPEVQGDSARVLRYLNTILLSLGMLFAVGFWSQWAAGQKDVKDTMTKWQAETRAARDETTASIHALKLEIATNSTDRFRSTDWTKAKDNLDVRFNTQDSKFAVLERRVDKVEDAMPRIQKSLDRVEAALGSNPSNKN